MEYAFGVTASTSELQVSGATYVRLRLVAEGAPSADDPAALQEHVVELELSQFFTLLHALERAKLELAAM